MRKSYTISFTPAATSKAFPGLANYLNNGLANIYKTTVSEIVAATHDGMTLICTDSPGKQIGFVDINLVGGSLRATPYQISD